MIISAALIFIKLPFEDDLFYFHFGMKVIRIKAEFKKLKWNCTTFDSRMYFKM